MFPYMITTAEVGTYWAVGKGLPAALTWIVIPAAAAQFGGARIYLEMNCVDHPTGFGFV